MTLYRFAGGKVVEEWTVYNELEMMRQIGLSP
jgi:predicted ester cyclase